MAQSGCRDTDGMGELECDAASAYGNGGGSQKTGNQGDVSDRTRAQIAFVEKEENRATTRANEARETPEQAQGKCRDGESPQENTKQAFQLEFDSIPSFAK